MAETKLQEPKLNGQAQKEMDASGFEPVVLKFADSKIPTFKEKRNKDYIEYGDKNLYPEYLTYLFDKSAKHNAIVNGKARYIFGNGFENGNYEVNRLGDTLNDVSKKCILDIEIYGGFYMEVVWGYGNKIAELYHVEYDTIRLAKGGGYYFSEDWCDKNRTVEKEKMDCFNPDEPFGSQIFSYHEYRPGTKYYPLPEYIAANNYIETDIEISKFYLSSIRNGMNPSKMLQFFKGEPTEEKKKQIERRLTSKYTGAENAGRFVLVFNDKDRQQQVQIDDLSGSDLDKMFVELNKTTQQEIYAGHGVTSPMLFGIKTEGQLGGNNELQIAYAIFQNTYAKPKAQAFDKEINCVMEYTIFPHNEPYKLTPSDPIGIVFDVKDFIQQIPTAFVFEKLGIPKEYWSAPNAAGTTTPTTIAPTPAITTQTNEPITASNETLKNLTAKQHQQMLRIVRQYKKGVLEADAARMLLKTSLGLTDEEVDTLFGKKPNAAPAFVPAAPAPVQMKMESEISFDDTIQIFDEYGESKNDFEILSSRRVMFSEDDDSENVFIEAYFADGASITEKKIVDLLAKDPKMTDEVIAKAIGETKTYVAKTIKSMEKKGLLETVTEKVGIDKILKRTPVPVEVKKLIPTLPGTPKVQIMVKYSYEPKPGLKAIIEGTRPFCRKLIELNRLYTRADIEKMSDRLGYSVFDRKGGFWNTGHGVSEECRHRWVAHVVVKKSSK